MHAGCICRNQGNDMKFLFVLFSAVFLLGCAQPAQAEFYRYQDAGGAWHFTDDPANIPENQLDSVKAYVDTPADGDDAGQTDTAPTPAPQIDQAKMAQQEYQMLNQEKAALDAEYDQLQRHTVAVEQEGQGITDDVGKDAIEAYNRKVTELNAQIEAFEIKRTEFLKKVDAFNAKQKKD